MVQQLYRLVVLVVLLATTTTTYAQYDYDPIDEQGGDPYGQDSLYHDYAMKQQEKEIGKPGGTGVWSKVLIGTSIGWMIGGKVHSGRKEKKLLSKHKKDQKELYTQYYNDVYTLQQQNSELVEALESLGVRVTR